MRRKNVKYIHLYEEGNKLDFDMGLYMFEQQKKFFEQPKNQPQKEKYPKSVPTDITAITRKKEFRDIVDITFDGTISFMEYILYQYQLSPKDLMSRSQGSISEELRAAMKALSDVNEKIKKYEEQKAKYQEESEGTGTKALRAKNELAQLLTSPLAENLRCALIHAEAAIRAAGGKSSGDLPSGGGSGTNGLLWWMEKDLKAKKERYGTKKSNQ